ncbi:hypothetical protein HanXRQr2_Chr12g0546531 [Helianthus annuus]|uniref:Uncharacterized protein n=1 Tax=Helianthus annuus TaxID=4232 RepID=A0A9K3HHK0_HELAN|nr:hypothetical protein HanXRQr2_Chr12g0546531 [Helianthus annuus]KAJ0863108.1 hypothetical protein HanPSC8_Chr12g0526091 [Helianthus annuus]
MLRPSQRVSFRHLKHQGQSRHRNSYRRRKSAGANRACRMEIHNGNRHTTSGLAILSFLILKN